jgi:hypothetical protein
LAYSSFYLSKRLTWSVCADHSAGLNSIIEHPKEETMPKFLTLHEESNIDRISLESRWTEISRDPRADWQMTLFNLKLGKRFCEWDAANREILEQIFDELSIPWSEIIEVEVTSSSDWRLWEIESGKRLLNCWEAMNCGRGPGAHKVDEKEPCPVTTDTGCWGKNRGLFAGRYCWKVVGTQCGGEVQSEFAQKMMDCAMCEFFQRVKREEGSSFES